MNPELPRTPREELELRVTALLLGELSAAEAASVYAAIASNPELTRLHDDLKQTIHLVRQATANASSPTPNQTPPPQLSEERRRGLRTHFAIPPLKPEDRQPKPRRAFRLLAVLAAISLVAVLAALLLPALAKTKSRGQRLPAAKAARFPATELMLQRDSGNRADARPASPSPDSSIVVAAPAAAISSSPASPQIVLPSRADADADGVSKDMGDQSQTAVDAATPIVAMTGAGGIDFKAGVALRGFYEDRQGIAPAPPGLPQERVLTRGVVAAEGAGEAQQRVFRERYGSGSGVASGRERAGDAVVIKGASEIPVPASLASPAPALEVVASPAPAATVTQELTPTSPPPPPRPLVAGDFFTDSSTPAGAPAGNVPVLGDAPMAGKIFRSVTLPDGGASGGSEPAQAVAPRAEPPPEVNWNAKSAETITTNRSAPSYGYYADQSLALPPPEPEPQRNPPADTLLMDRQSIAPEAQARLAQNEMLAWTDRTHTLQGSVPNTEVSGSAGVPTKSIESLGVIVLPTAPEAIEQPAHANKTKPVTGPSRSLRLSDSGSASQANDAPALVEEGKRLLEAGRAVEAEAKFGAALEADPDHHAADYYLALTKETKYREADRLREHSSKDAAVQVEQDWSVPAKPVEALTQPPRIRPSGNAPLPQTYLEKKRELQELQQFGRVLDTKLSAEKTDLALPKTTMVEVMDKAVPAKEKSGIWRSLGAPVGGSFASTARIKVERDATDIEGLAGDRKNVGYDPYFIQTEVEALQSDTVLGKVVDALKLDEAWAANRGGAKLDKTEAIGLLKDKLDLKPVRNTSLVEIQAKSDQPEEAARIANAVAEVYKDQRQQERTKLASGGIAALEGRSQEQQEKIRRVQAELETLREKLKISDAEAGSRSPTQLIEAGSLRRITAMQIEAEARLVALQAAANKLKSLGKDELRQTLPRTRQNARLTESLGQLSLQEKALLNLEKTVTTNHPTYQSARMQLEKLNREVDENVAGIMNAIELDVTMAQAQVDALKKSVEDAQRRDIDKAQTSRPYFDKRRELEELLRKGTAARESAEQRDVPVRRPSTNAPIPQPEIQTSENNFSTFSLNVSDVSFKLAAASLEKGQMPDPASVRSEEFINAFDYRDPEPAAGAPIAFAWERARYPFAHNRDLLRFSLKTAAAGRQAGRPLNLVLLLDNSGSMERADRVRIIREALRVLAGQLQPQDKLSVITFARTARLVADGISGDKADEVTAQVSGLTPQGGTNLEEAMNLAYQTALRHYLVGGLNRVVLLTDGAANLGNVEPESLKQKVEAHRKQGVALDCFGIGWEGINDDLLEVLSRNGDGRYGFINSPEEAATEFAGQLAGALKVAASDVKVQVEFNPRRVTSYRQIGYAKHQLTKEQFRDNTVDAAEIAAQEAGNALYTVEMNPAGSGPVATVRCRFKIPGTTDYREHSWDVPYTGNAVSLEQASPAMRLAASASAFAEWLVASPFAGEVTPDRVLGVLSGVPEIYGADARPKKLEGMIRQAKSLQGK